MNKKEYLAKLRMYLQGLPISEIEDIISDYEEHFNVGISKGKSEEEIAKELGDPKEVAQSYLNNSEVSLQTNFEENKRKNNKKWLGIAAGIVIVVLFISIITSITAVQKNMKFSSDILNISSNGDLVRIGTNGIEVKDGHTHVKIGMNGIEVKDKGNEVNIGRDGVKIKDANNSTFKSSIFNFFRSNKENLKWHEVDEEKFEKIEGIKNISIASPFVDIKVNTENRDDVRIYYHGKMKTNVVPELVTKNDNENLAIELKISNNSYSVTDANVVLEVYIPTSFNGNINFTSSSGDIFVKEIDGKSFSFVTSSGDVFVENLKGKDINVSTSSGDMNLNKLMANVVNISSSSGNIKTSNLTGNLIVNTSSGDISIEDITSEDVKIATSSGDISISFNDNANYNINGYTSSGDFIPNKNMVVEENQKGRFLATIGEGIYSMKIQTSSGDVIFK